MSPAPTPFQPFATQSEIIEFTPGLVEEYGLKQWAAGFKLGTAGYRDLLEPADFFNKDVPFNALSVALMIEARAQLAVARGVASLHVGGEVRPHTQEFIDLAARIYAAHGIKVHLRPETERTTPIWLSSFGVFYEELDGGENFTASHSQSYKGGWKPMEKAGGQLMEMAGLIAERVRELVAEASSTGLQVSLAAADDALIMRDFDPISAYTAVLQKIVPANLLAEVATAAKLGFKVGICTEGGSMAPTARRIFDELNITVGDDGPVFFTHEEESDTYHGIGIVDGVNHGVDPGKWQVYKNVGAQDLLRAKKCDAFFIWDPDGDRFNMVTVAPAALAQAATAVGLEVDSLDDERCLVFFKPNQIYFMLTALKIAAMSESGELAESDWIVATTYPTSMSIGEIAIQHNVQTGSTLSTYRVPVGFKYFAELVGSLETQIAASTPMAHATDVTGQKTEFGQRPRLLMMAEESGGAAMGPAEPMVSRHGNRTSLAAKEKDAMQIGVMSLCLAAKLHNAGDSFASFYISMLEHYQAQYRFYERRDITLFDESLKGEARLEAQREGNRRKDDTVAFFANFEGSDPAEVTTRLQQLLPADVDLPAIEKVFHAGDGTFIAFEGMWFELRASGTDAVLRYYMEGRNQQVVATLNEALTKMNI